MTIIGYWKIITVFIISLPCSKGDRKTKGLFVLRCCQLVGQNWQTFCTDMICTYLVKSQLVFWHQWKIHECRWYKATSFNCWWKEITKITYLGLTFLLHYLHWKSIQAQYCILQPTVLPACSGGHGLKFNSGPTFVLTLCTAFLIINKKIKLNRPDVVKNISEHYFTLKPKSG